tara:strand:+ start:451 stop:729 length:279 start_codon:yes stop_codon:yes gene_type:complete
MAFSVESAVMLLERLSVVEDGVNKITDTLEKVDVPMKTKICPCWISSVEYYDSGSIQKINFNTTSKICCANCNPAYDAYQKKEIRSFDKINP